MVEQCQPKGPFPPSKSTWARTEPLLPPAREEGHLCAQGHRQVMPSLPSHVWVPPVAIWHRPAWEQTSWGGLTPATHPASFMSSASPWAGWDAGRASRGPGWPLWHQHWVGASGASACGFLCCLVQPMSERIPPRDPERRAGGTRELVLAHGEFRIQSQMLPVTCMSH